MPTSPLWKGRLVIPSALELGVAAADGEAAGAVVGEGLDDGLACSDGLEAGDTFDWLFVLGVHAATATNAAAMKVRMRNLEVIGSASPYGPAHEIENVSGRETTNCGATHAP